MRTINVHRDELLKKLEENRSAHQAIFEEACDGYQKEAEKILEGHLARVRSGKLVRVSVHLPVPENHTKDYDRVIEMVTMSTDSVIELEEQDFASYIMDDWGWKLAFLTSNSHYSGTAQTQLASDPSFS